MMNTVSLNTPQNEKKINIVSLMTTLQIGGVETQLCEIVTRLNRERFAPVVYCLDDGGPLAVILERHRIPVVIADTPPCLRHSVWRKFESMRALYAYFRKTQPDIVLGYSYHASLYGGLAAKLAGIPILITHRKSLGYFKDGKPGYQFAENILNRFTDGVIVNSSAVRNDVLTREKIAPQKLHVIYDGVDISKYAPAPMPSKHQALIHQQKARWGIAEGEAVIGVVANLRPCKGHIEYITAAAEVIKTCPATKFLCIGEERGMKAQLERLAQDLGIAAHVIFTGAVSNMPEMFHLLDIVVSASHEEGFSNALLEGMACGKPIVATAVGGTVEQVVHERTGLLVPPRNSAMLAQALISLLAHPDKAHQFGREARTRIETHFTIEKTVAKLEQLYVGFLQNR